MPADNKIVTYYATCQATAIPHMLFGGEGQWFMECLVHENQAAALDHQQRVEYLDGLSCYVYSFDADDYDVKWFIQSFGE